MHLGGGKGSFLPSPLQGEGRRICSVLPSMETQGLRTGEQTNSVPCLCSAWGDDTRPVCSTAAPQERNPKTMRLRAYRRWPGYLSPLPSGVGWERNLYSLRETHALWGEGGKVPGFLSSLESKLMSPGKRSLSIPPERNTVSSL